MIIIEDSRETTPLEFTAPYIDCVMRDKLDYGDYACVYDNGDWCPVVFERKSITDLFGTLSGGNDRFKKEVNRSIEAGSIIFLIVETMLTNVTKGIKHSKVNGLSIARTMFTYMIKHRTPFVCCKDRAEMSFYISEFFYSWGKIHVNGK